MAAHKPTILIVEDDIHGREVITDLVDTLGYAPCSPNSYDELKNVLAFEVFETALVDLDLGKWKVADKIDDQHIEDGSDIARLYQDIHLPSSVTLYSANLDFLPKRVERKIKDLPLIKLPKPLPPNMDQIREIFKPLEEGAGNIRRLNPLLRGEDTRQLGYTERLRLYKQVCYWNRRWIDFNFQLVGDPSWTVICGRHIEKEYYGKLLNGSAAKLSAFKIKTKDTYPDHKQLDRLAARRKAIPFVFWNLRETKHLEKQFELAGPSLLHIPDHLKDYFSTAVASACAERYNRKGKDVFQWCKQLTLTGQLETIKQIYKGLAEDEQANELLISCKESGLPAVVEIFKARVDDTEDATNVAWVELINWRGQRPVLSESFDLEQLRKAGVGVRNQKFEYTVYEMPNGDTAINIEPIAPSTGNPFNALLKNK